LSGDPARDRARSRPNAARTLALRYGCSAVSIALATWGRLLLDPVLGNHFPYATLFFAVLFTAWYGGFGPALAAVALGALIADYFLLPPRGSFALASPEQYVGMVLYLCTSLGIAVLGGNMHAAWRRAEANAQAAQRQAALIDQTYDAVLAWEWNGPIIFWNRGAERLYGFLRNEALGRVSHELLRTERPGGIHSFIDALEREGTWEGELAHTTLDGRKITVESRMVLVRETERTYVLETDRDITRRQTAEAALREANEQLESRVRERTEELARTNESLRLTEERFRLLVAGVRDYAILMLDPDGHVISWNAGAERIKGYRAEEIIGQHFSRFYPREDVEGGKPAQELRTAASAGQCEDEGWRVRQDGSRFWANVLITAIYGETGQLRGFSKVTRDMTRRRREEATLRESQARVEGIVDAAMDAVISINDDQRIVLFNAAAEKMFRCPAATAIGQSLGMLIPSRFRDAHRQHVVAFGKTGVTGRSMGILGALSGLRADGEEFPIETSISQLEVAGHKLFTTIVRDITERQRAEEALRESEWFARSTVDALSAHIAILDADGTIIAVNQAWRNFAAANGRVNQMLNDGTNYLAICDAVTGPDTGEAAAFAAGIRAVLGGTRNHFALEYACHSPDEQRWFIGQVTRFHGSGGAARVVVAHENLTERRKAEEELRKSEAQVRRLNADLEVHVVERTAQLEAANKELEAFSYSISHDLRAPLRSVDGFSQAVLEDYGPDLPEEGRRYLQTIRNAAQRMGELIDDLLTFSRLSRLPLTKRNMETGTLVRTALEEVNLQRPGHVVEVRIGELPACEGDPALLKQVWINLLSNALKYSRQREPAVVEIGCARENGVTAYFVRDNGTGFDMQYVNKLFGVFQRLHRAEEFEGTGVGLAIVQRVVHRHGGRVWAEAEVDHGATFYFTLDGGTPT